VSDEREVSGSGAPIFRHKAREPDSDEPFEISRGDPELIDAVTDHIETHLGPFDTVIHEIVSPTVHMDLMVVPPSEERPYNVVVTCGMAEREMAAPEDDLRRAELFVLLPADWPLEDEDMMQDERKWWPLRMLKTLARLPHEYDTWLWSGHTVPNGDPPAPYAEDTQLCGAIVLPAMGVPEAFEQLDDIRFLMVLPLHADEMQLKLDRGSDALMDRLDAAGVDPVIDPSRPSAVRRRRRLGLF
jgi:hypothetical protein